MIKLWHCEKQWQWLELPASHEHGGDFFNVRSFAVRQKAQSKLHWLGGAAAIALVFAKVSCEYEKPLGVFQEHGDAPAL
jgi:hypothetical protein